ncbi:MAG: RadC family protein [Longimicrobiales bacterium]
MSRGGDSVAAIAGSAPASPSRRWSQTRETIKDWPAPERPRERLRALGASALSARELLAILIGSGSSGSSAVEVAGEVLKGAGGSLRRLATASPAELARTAGVGPAVAARLSAALELGRRMARESALERERITGPNDVYARCAPSMRDLVQEEFRILMLDTRHAVTAELPITRGTLDASLVHAREVFRPAILESAAALILVHNHPSGDPTPSRLDIEVTNHLAGAGDLLGIPILDHIVIGHAGYISFVDAGLLRVR